MQELGSREGVDAAVDGEVAVVFKHNTTCPISARAYHQMESFEGGGGGARVFRVDVLENRDVSDYVAQRAGVEHQSPQVIVFREGRRVYDAALFQIDAAEVASRVEAGGG
jgi:bacillithiol system protein YtxJ